MATVAVSTEKLAEIKAEEAQPESAAPEVVPATQEIAKDAPEASTSSADAPGDVTMSDEDEKDKALRAVRQGMHRSPMTVKNCFMTQVAPCS